MAERGSNSEGKDGKKDKPKTGFNPVRRPSKGKPSPRSTSRDSDSDNSGASADRKPGGFKPERREGRPAPRPRRPEGSDDDRSERRPRPRPERDGGPGRDKGFKPQRRDSDRTEKREGYRPKRDEPSDRRRNDDHGTARPYGERNHTGRQQSKDKYAPKKWYDKKKKATEDKPKDPNAGTRLNKYLAHAGIASRREADELIKTGIVSVNGKVVTEMGYKVMPGDEVRYNNEAIKSETKRYVLLNKPKGYITTMSDERGRNTVMGLVAGACKERIYPVGRLDRNTTGLLLFTNDGEMAKRLTHPKHSVKKIYHVVLDKNLKSSDLDLIRAGLKLEDGVAEVDQASYVEGATKREIGIELHIGRNRIVRRIFEHLGYQVLRLDRVYFAGLTKKLIPRGEWRYLAKEEVEFLSRI